MGDSRYPALDGLRGVAALMVLFTHSSNAQMHVIPGLNVTGMGRMGLWLFFVLSAFLLTEQALRADHRRYGIWSIEFLLRRFFRIFPLFLLALLLDCALGRMSAAEFWQAITLQSGKGIFWTVPPEFQYYFLIPLVGLCLVRGPVGTAVCFALIVASLTVSVPLIGWQFIALFVTSSLLAWFWLRAPDLCRKVAALWPLNIVAVASMIPIVISAWLPAVDPMVPRDFSYVYAAIWAPVLFACVDRPRSLSRILAGPVMRYIGRVSFGVYLFHPLIVLAFSGLGFANTAFGGALVVIASIAAGAAAHHAIEDPARKAGYRLAARLSRWLGALTTTQAVVKP